MSITDARHMKSLIVTNSSLNCFRTCRYQYWLRYVLGLRRIRTPVALRIGGAFDAGVSVLTGGGDLEHAVVVATAGYQTCPQWADPFDWSIEGVEVEMMLRGWSWRYWIKESPMEFIGSQRVLSATLGRALGANRRTMLKGKVDGIVTWEGRTMLFELKTTSDDLASDSDYWDRLKSDPQLSIYWLLLEASGEAPQGILYNVVKKPTIGPLMIPLLDENKKKIVLDAEGQRVMNKPTKSGQEPRQTGDKDLGYVLQQRRQTPEEYGERLLADIGERPDEYFAQREIARHDGELRRVKLEVVQQVNELHATHANGRWYRSPGAMTCKFCEYSGICLGKPAIGAVKKGVEPGPVPEVSDETGHPYTELPEGFEVVNNVHPELIEEKHDSPNQ